MIGTLTVHFNANYGANLQAYALQKSIQKEMPKENVVLIDYRNDLIRNLYSFRPWNYISQAPYVTISKESIKRFIKMGLNPSGTIIRNYRFSQFRKKYINTTKTVYSIRDIRNLQLDTVVIGSDQIWNDSITEDHENVFWGSMKNDNIFVSSYAPSFGRHLITEKERLKVQKCIGNFDYLTVREPSMVELIRPYTRKEIHIVCDPVFLLNKDEWKKLVRPISKKYIFVYILERNKELLKIAEKVSSYLGLEIVILSDGKRLVHEKGYYQKIADPVEFISLLYNAEFIVTNSFHGTAFSVLFNKKFITLPDTKKSARMVEFLDICKLAGRICYNSNTVDAKIVSEEIDFMSTNNILEEMKKTSMNCIKSIIHHER